MFDNSIALKSKTAVVAATVAIEDLSQPGRVVRKDVPGNLFTIASQDSKENKGYETKRTVIRFDRLTTGSNVLIPNTRLVSQLVMSYAIDPLIGASEVCQGLASLFNFLYSGGNSGAILVAHDDATFMANVNRLLAGEK